MLGNIQLTVACAVVLFMAQQSQATIYHVDFGDSDTSSIYSGAAVLPAGGGVWNGVEIPNNGGPISTLPATALVDSTGAASSVTVAIDAFTTSSYQNTFDFSADPLLSDGFFLDNIGGTSGPATITIAGLLANTQYDVVGFAGPDANLLNSGIDLNGNTATPSFTTSALVAGDTYVQFTGTTDGSGNLILTWSRVGGGDFSFLSGLEFQDETAAVPEPSTFALIGVAAVMGLGVAYRRRRAK
jgi:hypothetical protein